MEPTIALRLPPFVCTCCFVLLCGQYFLPRSERTRIRIAWHAYLRAFAHRILVNAFTGNVDDRHESLPLDDLGITSFFDGFLNALEQHTLAVIALESSSG